MVSTLARAQGSLVGLLKYIEQRKLDQSLDALRNENGEVVCVFICPDTPMPYFDEYFRYVDESHFPRIVNDELLVNRPAPSE
jgi:cysteine synthase A